MPISRRVNVFEDQVEVLASMSIGELWDRMVGEFLGEFVRLDRQGLTAAELERELLAFMDALSPKPTESLARKGATVAYNQGRDASIRTAKSVGRIQYVVRSEVLDTNTCRPCQLLDGEIFEVGTSEYERNMPPAQCDGGDNCRGFYIPIGPGA